MVCAASLPRPAPYVQLHLGYMYSFYGVRRPLVVNVVIAKFGASEMEVFSVSKCDYHT